MKPMRSLIEHISLLRSSAVSSGSRSLWGICLIAALACVALLLVAERATHANPEPPPPTNVFQPPTNALDVQVVAGKQYVFVADAGDVFIYAKGGTAPGAVLFLVKLKNLDLESIFRPLYGPDDPKNPRPNNVNAKLGFGWPAPPTATFPAAIPCFIEDPKDWRRPDANPVNPYDPPHPPEFHTRSIPTSSCITQREDVRIAYDDVRDVYYVAAAFRNLIWKNTTPGSKNPDINRNPAIAEQARRFVFLAVSRPGANPTEASSYDAFTVADDYADWPLIGVRGDSLLVTHLGGQLVNFYGPGVLAKGGLYSSKPAAWPQVTHHAKTVVMVRNHATPAANQRAEIFFIGPNDINGMAINAAVSGAPNNLVTATLPPPFSLTGITDAVMSGGRLHVVAMQSGQIAYFSLPVGLSSQNKIAVGKTNSVPAIISDPTDPKTINEDSPCVEVTKNGDVVVSYRAAGTRSTGQKVLLETRYSILYHGEANFRPYEVLKAGAPGATLSTLNKIDFARGWLDPNGLTVWIAGTFATGIDGNSPIIGAVTP